MRRSLILQGSGICGMGVAGYVKRAIRCSQ